MHAGEVDFKILRSQLEKDRKHLLQDIETADREIRLAQEMREGSPFGKREEEATESFELEKRLALEKQIRERLAESERALKKLDEGTYGRCDRCGQAIPPERLEALPEASLCLSCKALLAKHAKGK